MSRPCMTTKKLEAIKKLHAEGLYDTEIAERLGMSTATVFYWRHYKLGLPKVQRHARKKSIYMVYLRKTDELLACGTADECARMLGMKRGSFYSMVSRSKNGTAEKYEVVRMEGEEDGEPEKETL